MPHTGLTLLCCSACCTRAVKRKGRHPGTPLLLLLPPRVWRAAAAAADVGAALVGGGQGREVVSISGGQMVTSSTLTVALLGVVLREVQPEEGGVGVGTWGRAGCWVAATLAGDATRRGGGPTLLLHGSAA